MKLAEAFNQTAFSRFINGPAGRVFRSVVGMGFLVVGYMFRDSALGVASMLFSILPLSAGAFDVCYVSALLGGPLSGAKIREAQHHPPGMAAPKAPPASSLRA